VLVLQPSDSFFRRSVSIVFPFYFLSFFLSASVCFFSDRFTGGEDMLSRRRCPFCRRWFHPHPRLKQRQKTCGRTDCRRMQKRKSDQQWRTEHPDYFRDTYALQKERYGTRSDYKRRYRQQHPDYVRRNASFVRKCRQQLRSAPLSPTSPDLHVTIESESASIRINQVSHTSRDIFVTLDPS